MILLKRKKELFQLKKIIKQLSKTFEFPIPIKFNKDLEESLFHQNKKTKKYLIEIGMNFKNSPLYNFNFNTKIVYKVIDIFHEYRHLLQYTQDISSETTVSIALGNIYTPYKKIKYPMLPQEIDAEIYGILNAKKYIKKYFPNINFEQCFLEYINQIPQWYGPYPLKKERPMFSSVEEALGYLSYCNEISYDYPTPIEYNGFDSKLESIRVSSLNSGAEQIHLIVKDLYLKGQSSEELYNATLNLMNKYKKKEEVIEDIQLNISKENSATTNTFLMGNKEIEKDMCEI